uniref:Uncharacterized protein n=1 Tax=Pristionchus pacificus TaxID=54126 RepID=A0A2A6B5V0_PRIPA|eukprot:PDM61233.1 hypothetical protein PRIPAC_50675 [Pristionchus pacificus]
MDGRGGTATPSQIVMKQHEAQARKQYHSREFYELTGLDSPQYWHMASAALLLALQNRQFQSGITIRASSRNAPTGNAGNSEGRPKVGIPTDD